MSFIVTNLLMLVSCYLFAATLHIKDFNGRVIFTGLLWLAQIIFTELCLGILGLLYLPALIALNSAISMTLTIYSLRKINILTAITQEAGIIRDGIKSILGWENIILISLGAFVTIWFVLAAYFLPPRGGADDIFYHLPPVYEFILKHKIFLLPLYQIKYTFAYPLNAELLFMWPAIFFHNQRWVDCVQYVVAIFGVGVVYGLARFFKHEARMAFFLGLLFLLTPVVLNQAESNYIDLITNVFFLTTLYFSLKFNQDGKLPHLYAAAVAGGLLVGMKYFMVVLWCGLQFFVLPRLAQKNRKHLLAYFFIIFVLGGLWYLRNFLVFGNALYPLNIFSGKFGVFNASSSPFSFQKFLSDISVTAYLLFARDIGLGTFNGGFGLAFWGIAFPSWIYVFLTPWRSPFKKGFHFCFWGQVILGFALFVPISPVELQWTPRWSIFIVPIGLLAMGEILRLLKTNRIFINFVKSYCVFSSVVSITLLSVTTLPNYRLKTVASDLARGKNPSEFKYYKDSSWYLPYMRFVAEPLDYLTRDSAKGLSCYMAADAASFWVTNIYGTKFQNRVWNLEESPNPEPDAYIYQSFESREITYVGKKIPLADVVSDPENMLITQTPFTYLFIKKNALNIDNRRTLLLSYYRETFPEALQSAKDIAEAIPSDAPILVTDDIGSGFQYLSMNNEIKNKIYWIPEKFAGMIIMKNNLRTVYTVGYPLAGFISEKIYAIQRNDGEISLYENRR